MPVKSSSSEEMEGFESVDKLLACKDGLDAFKAFLKSEFSDENIEFWLACEDLKKTKTSTQIALKANNIYCEFIKTEAPREVNIDHKTRDIISQNISQPTSNCFDDAQKLILCLMAKDSFPRFLRSENYKDLIKKQQQNGQKKWLLF
ncbi:regulator of G-protein signaling 21 [Spea bombifrons]|uniref:regulator of G-protein signaling 21 n=1 Tax=Spea bombifrons TaxID=233779 RepID=UPI00234B46A9|nr:regulator of G-protein signaling 21 [Spea bombifrons]